MESLPELNHCHQSLRLSLNHHRSSFPTLLFSLSFRSLPPQFSSSTFRLLPIRATSSPSPSRKDPAFYKPRNTFSQFLQTLKPHFSPVAETSCIFIAATAFFFMRFHHKPVVAAPLAPPSTVEPTKDSTENLSSEDNERTIEEQLSNNPSDIEALRSLIELKLRARKLDEAIQAIDRLIELEPEDLEWPLLKADMHVYNDDYDLAIKVFEEILKKNPFRVQAYHGLVMATSESNQPYLKGLLKRVEEALESCEKQNRMSEVRDFKLLVAQIKVMEGELSDALKDYQELVKEEPRDFRPYLCQGIIYTLLRKKDEAEKQFEKFRRLVPKDHPYMEYFEDNMFATNFFSQKPEMEGAGARS